MKRRYLYAAALAAVSLLGVFAHQQLWPVRWAPGILSTAGMMSAYQPGDELLGGAATVLDSGTTAYGRSLGNIAAEHWPSFYHGRGRFSREWDQVKETRIQPLGPLFSAVGCERCHEKDGRGKPLVGEVSESMTVHLSVPGPHGTWIPDPVYGGQLDLYGVDGMRGEGILRVQYSRVTGDFADGSSYTLMQPEYKLEHLAYGPLSPGARFSARVAPANFGLGLLEAIPEQQIVANADPDDRNADGISGRTGAAIDIRSGRPVLGRFGWKATQPTIEQQVARAFIMDLGITSSLYPHNGSNGTLVRHAAAAEPELDANDLRLMVAYVRLLAVPRQRGWDRHEVQRGRAIFRGIGCESCHIANFTTGTVTDLPELSNQVIHPYTDLLLHDMGAGLADDRPDGGASGSEWRTPPLWGIGLLGRVSGHTRLLHDGRARNIEEAILWHGGEAAHSQEMYRRLTESDRAAVLEFLGSL